jgi:hypothetical protein
MGVEGVDEIEGFLGWSFATPEESLGFQAVSAVVASCGNCRRGGVLAPNDHVFSSCSTSILHTAGRYPSRERHCRLRHDRRPPKAWTRSGWPSDQVRLGVVELCRLTRPSALMGQSGA